MIWKILSGLLMLVFIVIFLCLVFHRAHECDEQIDFDFNKAKNKELHKRYAGG